MSQDDRNYPMNSGLPSGFISNQSNRLNLAEVNTNDLMGNGLKLPEPSLNQNPSLLRTLKLSETRTLQSVYQSDTVVTTLSTSVQSLLVVPNSQCQERLNIVVASTNCLVSSFPKQPCQLNRSLFLPQPVRKRFLCCLAGASLTMTLLLWAVSQIKFGPDRAASPVSAVSQVSIPLRNGELNPQLAPPLQQLNSINLKESQRTDPAKLLKSTNKKQSAKQTPSKRVTQLTKVPLPTKLRTASTAVPVPPRMKAERAYAPAYQSSQRQVTSRPQVINHKASISAVSPSSQVSTYRLIGVFEFGDRSAALVAINHITQRISIGETLTPSGWKLTKVDGQKAVLQRGSKLHSIYVGQTF